MAEILGRQAYRTALGALGNPAEAEDIAQEALVKLYTRGAEIENVRSFPSWFYRVVMNLLHDRYRKAAREKEALEAAEAIREARLKSMSEPMPEDERAKLGEAIRAAIASLDEKHREAFILREVEGKNHAEIAGILGVPEGTVWSRVAYARRYLREKLKRAGLLG